MHGDRGAQHFSALPSVLGVPNPDLKAGIFEAPQKGGMVVVQKVVQWAGMTAGSSGMELHLGARGSKPRFNMRASGVNPSLLSRRWWDAGTPLT